MVEIETGSRIPTWRTFYFENGNSYISAANGDIWTKFGLLIDFDLLKAMASTDTKPEVVFSRRSRHLKKWIWRHISAVVASIWRNSVAWCRIMRKFRENGWNRNRKLISNITDVCFSKTEANNWDVDKIWFADRLWPSEDSNINKYETGTAI